jgi:RHS repeat-associated protein
MTDASGTTTYNYDDHDRLQTKQTPQGTLTYTYDPAGNVASMQSSNTNGVSVEYTYDSLNRLETVVDNRLSVGQQTTTYSYDPASNLATVTYPNGLQSTFTYDTLNRLTALNGYSYQLGPAGNRQSATEPSGRTVNWSYDGIYRLTNEAISLDPHAKNGAVSYGLDPVGNRLSQASTVPGIGSGTFAYDADDRTLSTEQYDNNGNTTVSGARTFVYDFENRLKSMNNGAVTLVYDGNGNRVAKTVGGATTHYLVDDLNPTGYAQVVEELVNGAVQRRYTYGLQRISQTQFLNSAWTTSFYGYDGFGSVRQLTDPTGAVTDTYDYDAWGNAVNVTGSTPNVYLYRGEQYDLDLGLYYLRARYYNPMTGRFLTRDPEGSGSGNPASLHKYLYVQSDPVNGTDSTGKSPDYTMIIGGFSIPVSMIVAATGALVISCAGLYMASGLSMGMASAMGLEVYGLYSPAPCFLFFHTRNKSGTVGKPRPAPEMLPPGDCAPWEYQKLVWAVNSACKIGGGERVCAPDDSKAVIEGKLIAKAGCILARETINIKCFRNGDVGHQQAVAQVVQQIVTCQALLPKAPF